MLIEALKIDNETMQMADFLRELLDILFVTLIKHLPVMTKEQAKMINRLKSIVKKGSSALRQAQGGSGQDQGDQYMMMGKRLVKVVGEIDDTGWDN